jgi:hypothetical protein
VITCTLGDKKYTVDFISGRAWREIEPATRMYARIQRMAKQAADGEDISEDEKISVPEALDVLVKWFCILFGNQFSPDDVYDRYPADRLMVDIPVALMAVQTATTEALSEFPMKPAAETKTG